MNQTASLRSDTRPETTGTTGRNQSERPTAINRNDRPQTSEYAPTNYPKRFQRIQHARAWAQEFFRWYNFEHYHSGIGFRHPADLHAGRHE